MSGIVQLLEESLVAFVKERVPTREWRDIHCRYGIEGRMEDDDLNELKDHCFNELMNEVNWKVIVRHIRELAENQIIETTLFCYRICITGTTSNARYFHAELFSLSSASCKLYEQS
jgi:hypothetical protein